ncbi:MAG: phosphoribosylglycinamide formyltransferase 1 [Solirubrobacteraceae bacterium]|jgi:phosphoribosylglycinamide formyltransferase-1|nr:phosphoribosylglycinamide formyltransferase 1 [Solirubrobacteraceae bacterium]
MRVGVLASGQGTNLQALLDTLHGDRIEVVAVASDQPAARALERAAGASVPARVFQRGAYESRAARDAAIADWLVERDVGLIVLAGYMAILDDAFLERFAGRIVNVHPSLLPAFPGVRAVEQALAYGAKVFGVTVHYVEPGEVDSGPIILQGSVEVPGATDPAEVLAALRPLEHALLPRAVALIAAGAVRRDARHPRRVVIDEAVAGDLA